VMAVTATAEDQRLGQKLEPVADTESGRRFDKGQLDLGRRQDRRQPGQAGGRPGPQHTISRDPVHIPQMVSPRNHGLRLGRAG